MIVNLSFRKYKKAPFGQGAFSFLQIFQDRLYSHTPTLHFVVAKGQAFS